MRPRGLDRLAEAITKAGPNIRTARARRPIRPPKGFLGPVVGPMPSQEDCELTGFNGFDAVFSLHALQFQEDISPAHLFYK